MTDFKVPDNLRYTKDHEWARREEDGLLTIGITDFAQDALGDITYAELPETGRTLDTGEGFGVVESVKTFSDLYAPVAGEVAETNAAVEEDASLINRDAYGEGWLIRLRPQTEDAWETLLDAAGYRAVMESGD
ncbi:MAG: glycine cleavage system protein GcvH [Deltaproteobacteria bacterium]|nr:MAG: glycine cleavage system protein GcvH [Deltaproteobacteria bacterium]